MYICISAAWWENIQTFSSVINNDAIPISDLKLLYLLAYFKYYCLHFNIFGWQELTQSFSLISSSFISFCPSPPECLFLFYRSDQIGQTDFLLSLIKILSYPKNTVTVFWVRRQYNLIWARRSIGKERSSKVADFLVLIKKIWKVF